MSAVGNGDCSHLHVANASLRSGDPKDSYPAGTVLRYRCIPGYEPIPGQTLSLTCLANSKWSIENPRFCQGKFHLIYLQLRRRCPTIDLANGRIVKSNDLRLGDEITLGCDEGHRMVGEKTLRCRLIQNKVDWDKELPLCQRVPCFPPPKIANGQHSTTSDGEYSYGTSVTYTCDPYHSLIGNRTITCLVAADGVTGEWRPAAPELVICSRPNIKNGRITTAYKQAYTYGNHIMFVCDRGYTLVGNDSSTCGADGFWHPPVPTCVRDSATISPVRSTKKPTSSTNSDNTPAIIIASRDGALDRSVRSQYLRWALVSQVLLLINAWSVNGKTAIEDLIWDEHTGLACITETWLDELVVELVG
nr:membrane cofactor protein [Zootoca vivipara]